MLITEVSDIRSSMNVTQPYCSVSSTLRYVPIVLSPQCYSLLLVILTILSYACLVSMQDYLDEAMVHGRSNLSHPMVSSNGSNLWCPYIWTFWVLVVVCIPNCPYTSFVQKRISDSKRVPGISPAPVNNRAISDSPVSAWMWQKHTNRVPTVYCNG